MVIPQYLSGDLFHCRGYLALRDTLDLATPMSRAIGRGPIPLAKSVGAMDRLAGDRLMVALDLAPPPAILLRWGSPLMNVRNGSRRLFQRSGL